VPREILLSDFQTIRYVTFFVFGILVASRFEFLAGAITRYAWSVNYLWLTALLLLAVPYTKGYLEFCYALGAFILLTLCVESTRAHRLLRHSALQWLGKVSYSLYLVHLVVLLSAVYLLHDLLPIWAILLLALVGSLLAAELLNRAVELPSNEIGKRLAARTG
jgi:peptidoglycan/LPS O-acetylase OafA/YrhL